MAERSRISCTEDQRGVAYVEFLIAFVPVLLLFLGVVQLGLIFTAKVMVKHAAYRATRTAMVVLDDEPRFYLGEGRNRTDGEALTVDQLTRSLRFARRGSGLADWSLSRRATVELSAATLLASVQHASVGSIAGALRDAPEDERARAMLDALELDIVADSGLDPFVLPGEPIRVDVRYRYDCPIPIVNRIVCDRDGSRTLEASSSSVNQGADYPYLSQVRRR